MIQLTAESFKPLRARTPQGKAAQAGTLLEHSLHMCQVAMDMPLLCKSCRIHAVQLQYKLRFTPNELNCCSQPTPVQKKDR